MGDLELSRTSNIPGTAKNDIPVSYNAERDIGKKSNVFLENKQQQ